MASRSVVLHAASGTGPRSLALFAGRYVGEEEFAILQTYVADRIRPLLETRAAGIVYGLSVGTDGSGDATRLSVRPGLAIGGDGRAIQLHRPLALDWPALRDIHKRRTRPPEAPDAPLNGWFYLTIRREVAAISDSSDARACDRDQLDVLRDARVETLASLGLQFAGAGADLMDPPAALGVNRVGRAAMDRFEFDTDSGAVPVALVKIVNDAIAIEADQLVVMSEPGRLPALPLNVRPDRNADAMRASASAFALHWESHRSTLPATPLSYDPDEPLRNALGVDFLPPAGHVPGGIVNRIAGRPTGADWLGPDLRFDADALQIDITAVPASQIDEVIARESARGPIDLTAGSMDRIRLVVAVSDHKWRPDLMDLPEADALLQDAVHLRQREARNAWRDWAAQWSTLYSGLDHDATDGDGELTDDIRTKFKVVRPPAPPAGSLSLFDSDDRAELNLGPDVVEPPTGVAVFQRLIAARREEASSVDVPLPRPYALGVPDAPEDLLPQHSDVPDFSNNGLYQDLFELEAQIAYLESELDANDRLVADFDVFIRAQRQQVDSITTSFAALAGGVPGDGAGLQLARWMPYTQLLDFPNDAEGGD